MRVSSFISGILLFMLLPSLIWAQPNITKMEYFIDADPGIGLATDITLSAAPNLNIGIKVPTTPLSFGFHLLSIRAQDQNGVWSMFENKAFFVSTSATTSQNDISKIEYFIDTDPGIGSGVDVPITAATSFNFLKKISTATLSEGFHLLSVRAQDENGVWSLFENKAFFVTTSATTSQNNITKIEYFIDTDPGIGSGVDIPITAATNFNFLEKIPTSTLTEGFHLLSVRAQDENGVWSLFENKAFFVTTSATTSQNDITKIEYFIDTDPGQGSGVDVPITSAGSLNFLEKIPTATLTEGFHLLTIRAQDEGGNWSLTENKAFFVDKGRQIIAYEYAIDIDPGIGLALNQSIIPSQDSINQVLKFDTNPLPLGGHNIFLRIQDSNLFWSKTQVVSFAICDGANASFTATPVCLGSASSFTDGSQNVLVSDVYSWDFDGDGFEDSNLSGDQSFTFLAPGTYMAKLTIDRLGCLGKDSVEVTVEPQVMANAGIDQALCTTGTTLTGNPLSANETGTWLITKGTAIITNINDPLSTLTAIATDSIELTWSVTNLVAGCSDIDSVFISSSQPITAVVVNRNIDIGQSINIDVQSLATTSSGDILITTIITPPQFGADSIGSDGSINYTPNPDAPTSDFLVYRITNQCNNFDEAQINFSIVNLPPVIDSVSLNTSTNSTEAIIDLKAHTSDPNGNIDITSIAIISQPISGAIASIDANSILTIDYRGISFTGTDLLEIQVCDLSGVCTIGLISIPNVEVGGVNPPLTVFNGVSPNGDGFNDFLEIENIEFYPQNVVVILNRWGAEIAKYQGYNNQDIIFNDATIPSGTYYYHILSGVKDVKEVTGHFVLKID